MPSYRVIKNLSNRKIVVLKKVKKKKKPKHSYIKKNEVQENAFAKSLKLQGKPENDVHYDASSSSQTWSPDNKVSMKMFNQNLVQNQNNQFATYGDQPYPMQWKYSDNSSSTSTSCNCHREEIPLNYKLHMPVRPVANCIEVNDEAIKRVTTNSNTELRLQNYFGNMRPSKSKENFLSNHPYNVIDMLPTTNFENKLPICNSACDSQVSPVNNFSDDPMGSYEQTEDIRCYPCDCQDYCNCFEARRSYKSYSVKPKKKHSIKSKSKPRVCSHCGFCEETGTCVGLIENCMQREVTLPVTNFSRPKKISRIEKKQRKHLTPTRFGKHGIQRSISTQSPSFSETSISQLSENLQIKPKSKKLKSRKSKQIVLLPSASTDSTTSTGSKNSQKDDDIVITLRNAKGRGKSSLKKAQLNDVENSERKQKRIKFVDILFNDLANKNSTSQGLEVEDLARLTTLNQLSNKESPVRTKEKKEFKTTKPNISSAEEEPSTSTVTKDDDNNPPVKSPSNNSNLSNSSTKDIVHERVTSSPNGSVTKTAFDQGGIKNHIKCLLDSWSAMNGNQKNGFDLKKKIFGKKSPVDQDKVENTNMRENGVGMSAKCDSERNQQPRNSNLCNYSTHATTSTTPLWNQKPKTENSSGMKKNFIKKLRRPKAHGSFFKKRFNKMKKSTRTSSKNTLVHDDSKNKLLQHESLPYIDDDDDVVSKCVPFYKIFSNLAQHFSKDKDIFKLLESGPTIAVEKYSKNDTANNSNHSQNNSHDNSESSRKKLPSAFDRSPKFKHFKNSQPQRDTSRRINHSKHRNGDNRSRAINYGSNFKTQNPESHDLLNAFSDFMSNYRHDKTSKHGAESGSPFIANERSPMMMRRRSEEGKDDASKQVQNSRRDCKHEENLYNNNDTNLRDICKQCSCLSRRSSEVLDWLQKNSVGKMNRKNGDDCDRGGENRMRREDEFVISVVEQVKSLAIDQLKEFFYDPESEWNKQLHECFKKATNILNFFHECIRFKENVIAEKNENNCRCNPIKHFSLSSRSQACLVKDKSMQTPSCMKSQKLLLQKNFSDVSRSRKTNILRPSASPNKIHALERAYETRKGSDISSNHELETHLDAYTSPQCVTNSDVHRCPLHSHHTWCSGCPTVTSHPVSRRLGQQEIYKQACSHTRDCFKWLGRDYYTNIHRNSRV